jgi:hypothetical protein
LRLEDRRLTALDVEDVKLRAHGWRNKLSQH